MGRRLTTARWLLGAALFSTSALLAQTLAHPGLAGNGLSADPWWLHAIFYQTSGRTPEPTANSAGPATLASQPNFKAITGQLEALRSFGVDALLLPMPRLPAQNQPPAQPAAPSSASPDPTLDDFDEMMHQASRHGIRVLLSFPASTVTPELSAIARFWLSRGVAGLHVVTPPRTAPQDTQAIVQALRRIAAAAVGQRIVISDFEPDWSAYDSATAQWVVRAAAPSPARNRPARAVDPQMQIDSRLNRLQIFEAANFRAMLAPTFDRTQVPANLLLDFHPSAPPAASADPYPALARVIATMLLTTRSAALIDADEAAGLTAEPTPVEATAASELARAGPASLADWYRQLIALHHGNAALRFGSTTMLNFDPQNALVWVARPAPKSVTPPVIVACNLSSTPAHLALGNNLRALNLRGTYLRTLLRSDDAMGSQDIDSVILPPFSVYIGELRR